jgi:hypothetical protein
MVVADEKHRTQDWPVLLVEQALIGLVEPVHRPPRNAALPGPAITGARPE